jgi:hypothetical protein
VDLADEIKALEIRQWEALRSVDDAKAYYADYFTGDALMATPSGIDDRESLLREIADSPVITDYEIRDPRIIMLGADAGAMVYTMTQWRKGYDPFNAAICSIFVRDAGRWRMAYHQQTPLQ